MGCGASTNGSTEVSGHAVDSQQNQNSAANAQGRGKGMEKGKGKGKGKGKDKGKGKGKGKAKGKAKGMPSRPEPGTQVEAAPVSAASTQYKPGKPFQMPQGKPPKPVGVVAMQPGHAMQMSSNLCRIFLGLGWKNAVTGKDVDVDASCIAFSQGNVKGAVWYQELKNQDKTLAHTGDVLVGAPGNGNGSQDLERIYIWLEKMDPSIDMVVMVANIYTSGVDFSDLSEAYVRVANADTNQELGRMWLAGDSWTKMATGKNAVVFAKAYRHGKHWQIMTLGQPLVVPGASTWQAMVPAIQSAGLMSPPSQPMIPGPGGQYQPGQPMLGGQPMPGGQSLPGGQLMPGQPSISMPTGKLGKTQKPSKLWPCVAVAAGGAVGVAAAIAIFESRDMNMDMLDPGQFTDGVDFGHLEVCSLVDGMDLAPPEELGDFVGEAMQAVTDGAASAAQWSGEAATEAWGAINESGVFEGTAEFAGDAGEMMMAAGGGAVDVAGEAGGAMGEWGGEAFGAAGEWGGEAAGAAGEWGGEAAGAAGEWGGEAYGAAGEWAGEAGEWGGEAAGAAGEWAGDAGEWGGEAAGAAGEWGGEAAGAAGEWGGEAAGAVGEWGGQAGEWGGQAAGAVGEWGGQAAGAMGEVAGGAGDHAGQAAQGAGELFGALGSMFGGD